MPARIATPIEDKYETLASSPNADILEVPRFPWFFQSRHFPTMVGNTHLAISFTPESKTKWLRKKNCKVQIVGTITRRRNCKVSVVPFYIWLGLIAAILFLREWQNQRTIRELLNRLLEKHGIEAIPEDHPLAEVIKTFEGETREEWPPKELGAAKKQQRERVTVRFPVPGMEILKTMLAKRKVS
jgi:hypothetical protein